MIKLECIQLAWSYLHLFMLATGVGVGLGIAAIARRLRRNTSSGDRGT